MPSHKGKKKKTTKKTKRVAAPPVTQDTQGMNTPDAELNEGELNVLPGAIIKVGMSDERIAEICHEVDRAYCEAWDDFSPKPWAESSPELRSSVLAGVKIHRESDISVAATHEAWVKFKMAEGWSWGPEKDEEELQHPSLLAFHQLPREQRAKDFIFKAIVEALSR